MAKCINTSHPDFKKLEQGSGIGFLDLEIMVSDWQSARNTDEFPTLGDLPEGSKSLDINSALKKGFLKDLNFTVTEYDNIKKALGYDAVSMLDLVTKKIIANKDEPITKEVAYLMYKLFSRDASYKIKSELKYLISTWDKYQKKFDFHKNQVEKQLGYIADSSEWKNTVRERVIIDFLEETLLQYYNNPKEFEKVVPQRWSKEDFTLLKKILRAIKKFMDKLGLGENKVQKQERLINLASGLAQEVLTQEYSVYDFKVDPSVHLKNYEDTLSNFPEQKKIVEDLQEIGIVVSGSLSLRKAGSVYRTVDESLHDIDSIVPYNKVTNDSHFESVYKQAVRISKQEGDPLIRRVIFSNAFEQKYLHGASWYQEFLKKHPNTKKLTGFIGSEHANGYETYTYTVVIDGKFDEKGEYIEDTGTIVDFFIRLRPDQFEHSNYFATWKEIITAKLLMGGKENKFRKKDLVDLINFVPFVQSGDKYDFYTKDFIFLVKKEEVESEDVFYELDSEPRENVDQKVKEELLSILNRNGIAVTSMSEYEETYSLRTGKPFTVRALADTLRNIIAVDESLESNRTLSEEAMHMAVAANVDTFEFNRAMRLVVDTAEYTDNYEKYEQAYKAQGLSGEALERKVRMEILGKVGKELLFQEVKSSTQGTGIGKYLRKMWNRFLDLFRPAKTELEKILAKWSDQLISGNLGEIQSEGTFFEIEDTPISEAEKLYKKFLAGLKSRALTFKRFEGESEAASERLLKTYYEFTNKEFNAGLVEFVGMMAKDISNGVAFIKKYQDGTAAFTSREWRDMKIMLDYYDAHRKQLEDYMAKSLAEDGILTDEQIEEVEEYLGTILTGLNKIKGFHRRAGLKLTEEHVIAEVKDAISDPELQKKEIESLLSHLREVDFDSNRALYWAGSLVHAKDSFLRNVHYTMTKVRRSVDRFTYDLGKKLTKEAERLGIKDTSKFIEKIGSKFSHYFIDRFRYGAFTQASVEFHKQRHVKYGLPEDKIERRGIKNTWREASIAVAEERATPEQEQLAAILAEYNKEVAQWFTKNTVPKEGWQQIVEQVKKELGGGTTPEFQEWKEENIGISQPGTKWEREYPKGVLVEPSDGRVKVIQLGEETITVETKDWRNPEYDKLTDNEKEYLGILLDTMEEADTKHSRVRHRLQLPQIKASTVDLLKSRKFSNIVENIKDIARTTTDDTEFGEDGIMRPDGTVANFVPVYFINRLDNADQISQDLTSSVLAYSDVMENFKQMTKQAPMFEMILDTIGERQVKTDKKAFLGLESETYKSMKNFLEMNLYGKWKEQWIVGGVNVTKLMQGVVKYVTANNLAFSLYTTLASYFTSATYSKIEDLVGQFTTQSDKLFAEKVWDTNIHQVLLESGKTNKTSKLGLFFEHHRILDKNKNIFDNLDKSRLTRQAVKSGLFWSYDLVRLRVRGKLALAIASNYRYYNGKFKTKRELENLGVKDIGKLPTYYDMVEVKDGRLVAKHSDPKIEDIIERRIEFIGANIDGELNYSDWAAAHRGALTQLVTTHRGWLFRNIQLRLKPKGVNYQTGEMDEGWYLTTFDFIRKTFLSKERVTSLKSLLARWETLDAYEKQGVLRTLWETAFIFAVSSLAMILNNLALDSDDDDDLIQYLAYQSNRVLLELGVMNPSLVIAVDPFTDHPDGNNLAWRMPLAANIQELVAILNSPVAATRQLDDLMDLTHLLSNQEIESGPYEGMTKRERLLIKMIPGMKGLYQARDPKSRNQFLKNKTLSWLYQ